MLKNIMYLLEYMQIYFVTVVSWYSCVIQNMTFGNYISFDNLTFLTFANVLILLPNYHDRTMIAFLKRKRKISTQAIWFNQNKNYCIFESRISEYFKQKNCLLSKHFLCYENQIVPIFVWLHCHPVFITAEISWQLELCALTAQGQVQPLGGELKNA